MTYEGYTGDAEAWFAETERLKGSTVREAADPPPPESAYEGYSHDELYQMIHVDNDPGQLGDMAEAWTHLANIMAEFSDQLTETVNRSHTVWQGEAADAARTFTSSLAVWGEQTGAGAQLVAHQTLYHSSAAQASRDEMEEPLPSPKMIDSYHVGHLPEHQEAAVEQAHRQAVAAEQARQRAIAVMNNYDVQIQPTSRPSFPAPPQLGGGDDGTGGITGTGSTSPSGTPVALPGIGGGVGSGVHTGSGGTGGSAPGNAGVTTPGGVGGTTPGGAGGPTPGGAGGSGPGGTSGPVTGALPPGRPPGTSGGPGSLTRSPGNDPGRPSGQRKADVRTPLGTGVKDSAGDRAGRGDVPGAGRGASGRDRVGGLGRGVGDGAGVRSAAGGAGQPGRAGMSGVPMSGGRAQRGEDDDEHKSKYTDGWDNDEVWFGDMPPTAPDVIGRTFEPRRPEPKARGRGEPTP